MANINIGGRLHSTATGNTVAGANEILDDSKGKKQSVINQETDAALAGKQATIDDLSTIRSGAAAGATAYQKPASGVPASDMSSGVQTSLGKADTAYQKPGAGVPKTDLESGVQASLDLADSAIQARPMGEIDPTITPADYATKEELDELEAKVIGVVYTEGKYLDKYGAEQVHADWGITDYIPYTQGNDVVWKWGNTGTVDSGRSICFYNANKNFISNGYWQVSGTSGQKTISASSIASDAPTAAFLRASVLPAQSPTITIGSTVVWQVVKGLTKEIEEVSNDLNTLSLRVDNGIYSEIQNPVYRNQTYIRYSDGELIGSGTYSDTISFPNLGYSKVKVTVALPDSGVAAIAFYNGKIGWAETYISGVQGSAGTHTYEANVPDGCTVIVVTNRNNVLASPSILTTVNGYVGSLATLINYNNPFGNKPFMFHFEQDGFLKDGDGNNLVPGECLESIRIASRLGFAFIEANVKKTSDGHFYVMHGQDGKFGDTVYSLDETDISETDLESVTLDYIQENIRYKSIESKYAKLATLEEFLQTAKDCGIGVFLGTQEIDAIKLGIKYLGQDNILVYGAPSWYRSIFKGFMNIWHNTPTTLTVEELLAEADHFGRPYIGSIGPSLISALKSSNSLNTYVEEMHKRGYCVGFASAYQTEEEARELIRMGFDFSGAGHDVNPFIPNYEQIDINGDSSQFVTTGTFDGHTLVLASGQSVSFGNQTRISLGMGRLLLKFNGAITVTFGSFGARTVTSSGEETVVISDYFLRRGTDCIITATANTTIEELAYLTSKC